MKNLLILIITFTLITSCNSEIKNTSNTDNKTALNKSAEDVRNETLRTWQAYKKYAWGHDALAPLTKTYRNWYKKPLYISPIDAYSTLYIMGFKEETNEIENYVIDSLDFDIDIDAKIFEVNIRILGGLLSMYELSGKEEILAKAKDFADRMLPAFDTKTGIPKYWVNLKTGVARGDTVNVAEAATYTFEMGILSYYTKDPKYYQAGKKASLAIFNRRSDIGLIGDVIDVESGEWVSESSHICAGVDSYYEYLYKSYLLFGDNEMGEVWKESIKAINKYIAEDYDGKLWYGRVHMNTGEFENSVITLYDAFFPALLGLSGDTARAIRLQHTWDYVWNKYGLEPTAYDYKSGKTTYPTYDLNPEIMESAYYLFNISGDSSFYKMNEQYWADIKKYCRTDIAYTSIKNVETMEKKDYMPTFFFAETLKYLYLTFTSHNTEYQFNDYTFNTEAHPFKREHFDKEKAKIYLGFDKR
ncbi:MAG: glycoside hydrolase family 47 [Marinilabiliales bacterium]|nr:MAG: glycoside hydrolase family 47 [Marinilabiliales bacterium]